MKTTAKALVLVLLSLPLLASAAGKAATSSLQVSFVVKESCNVQSAPANAAAKSPTVACQLNTPYQMTRDADKAAAKAGTTPTSSADTGMAIRPEAGAQDWTITF